jgi:hypothetical protein
MKEPDSKIWFLKGFMRKLKLSLFQIMLVGVAFANPASNLKLTDLPTLDNMVTFVRTQNPDAPGSRYKSSKSAVEKNIYDSLIEDPSQFCEDLSTMAVEYTLSSPDGVAILKRIDAVMTSAVQDMAEKSSHDLQLKDRKGVSAATAKIQKIRVIEKKRDELALMVFKHLNDSNFNSIFDYLVQSHFRRAEGLNQTLSLPKDVKEILYGRNNPNQGAFKSLKKMTVDVLASANTGPLQKIRRLKISGTAELVPAFKPTLHAWEVEAYYFRRSSNRIPSSTPAQPKK